MVAPANASLNQTLTKTFSSPLNLSDQNSFYFDLRSSRTGSNIKIGLRDSGGTTTEVTPNITSANTFQTVSLDISGVANIDKDNIDQLIITITNADNDNTFYLDNFYTEEATVSTGTILSTAIVAANINPAVSTWNSFTFNSTPASAITYQVYYDVAGTPTLVSDSDLPSNSTGFTTSPISLTSLNTTSYPILYVKANLSDATGEPVLADWGVSLSSPPSAPSDPKTENLTNPNGILDTTPEFSAVHNDLSNHSANYYQIEVNTSSDFTGTVMWDSGQQSMTTTSNGARSPDISYAGNVLTLDGTIYYWRIRFWNVFGLVSPWSDVQNFTMNIQPNVPVLNEPANDDIDQNLFITFLTTGTDTDGDDLRYKIELCTNLTMNFDCQTFDQTISQTGWSGQNTQTSTAYTSGTQATYTIQSALQPDTTYYWRSWAIDPLGKNAWSATQSPPNKFTTLATPLPASSCLIQKSISNSQLSITWTDNATNEDFYEVQRSVDGGAWTVLQTSIAANTVNLVDNTVSSGHSYQYRIAPYFSNGPYYSAWCSTSNLELGVGLFNLEGLNVSGLHFN